MERGMRHGEEPYSIAMTICDSIEFAEAWKHQHHGDRHQPQGAGRRRAGLYPRASGGHRLKPRRTSLNQAINSS